MVSLTAVFMVVILVVSQLTYIICNPLSWFNIGGGTQLFNVPEKSLGVVKKLNWIEARDHCVSLGADLAQQPDNMEELAKYIMEKYPSDSWYHVGGYHMGGSDGESNQATEWRWVNGHKINKGWAAKPTATGYAQPYGVGECMSMGFTSTGGSLTAELCTVLLPFICQRQ